MFLKQKLFSLKMKDRDSLDDHLRRMKEITDKLAAIKAPIPEDEHIVALLLSLPRSYNTLITAFTAKVDDLSLTQVHQALMSEEEKRGLYKGKDGGCRVDKGETALQHEKTSRKPIKCQRCGGENHVIRNCPKRKKGQHENRNINHPYKHKATPADADGKRNEDSGDNVFVVGLIAAEGNSCWIIDSGASQHMTANRDLVVNYCEFPEPEPVALGDGRSVNAYGYGQVDITMILGNKEKDQRKSILTKVLYVPKLATNLFSARAAASKGKVVQFGHTLCWIKDSKGQVVARGRLVGNMYRLDCKVDKHGNQASIANETGAKLDLWHQRMAHLNAGQMKIMA